jgi:hypothetical protein
VTHLHSSAAAPASRFNEDDERNGRNPQSRRLRCSGRSSRESPQAAASGDRCRSRQVFGLPGASQLVSQLIYWMPLPKVRIARAFSADGIGRSQSPLRGSSGIGLRRTGFSLRSGCWARHRDEAQDIVVGDERQPICKPAMNSARRLARTQVLTDAPALFGIEIAPTLTQFLALLRR